MGTLEPNTWVDITATLERKIEALFCHASQLVETGDWFRQFLRDWPRAGAGGRVTYAEAFRRLAVSTGDAACVSAGRPGGFHSDWRR